MLTKLVQRTRPACLTQARAFAAGNSPWGHVDMAPPDAILGITEAFKRDTNPKKQLLGAGTFKTNEGKPYILPCITKAEQILIEQQSDHEYAPIDGLANFRRLASNVAFGENHEVIQSGRVANCQALSGTGSLRLGFDFLREWFPNKDAKIMVSDPTWPTHRGIAARAGFQTVDYRYYDRKNNGFDLDGMLEDLNNAPDEQIVILHSCAHNPTGQDPTHD